MYLADIVNGELKENPDNPYDITLITSNDEEIKRTRLIGTVVDKYFSPGTEEKKAYTALVIDDGTDTLRLKGWEDMAERMNEMLIGDEIEAYGRPNEDENERYIVPDKIIKIKDYKRELYLRAIKVKRYASNNLKIPKISVKKTTDEEETNIAKEDIRNLIFDNEEGMTLDELMKTTDIDRPTIEEAIQDLANDGDIYEPETGLFKRV